VGRWLGGALALALIAVAAGAAGEVGEVRIGEQIVFRLRASVGSISATERAAIVNGRLERLLRDPGADVSRLSLVEQADGSLGVVLGSQLLIAVTESDAAAEDTELDSLASRWRRQLRGALTDLKPLYQAPAEEHGIQFYPLLIVSGLAFLVPLITSRFRRVQVPTVVGEVLVGILVGGSVLGWVHYDSWLQFLAEFGFAYLMFLSGLEVDFGLLTAPAGGSGPRRAWSAEPLGLAIITFILTVILGIGFSFWLVSVGLLKTPWMMALVLSTTSLGVVVPTLRERGLTRSSFGQALLLAALVADFATMILITLLAAALSKGLTFDLLLGLTVFAVFFLLLRVGQVLARRRLLARLFSELQQATAQIQVRGAFALILVFVALSQQVGTEMILGAFLAGALVSLFSSRENTELHSKLEAIGYGFFIPIFFIMVGVRFDLGALLRSRQAMLLAPLLLVAAFGVKLLPGLLFRQMSGWRQTLAAGMLLSARMSLIIAAAEIGLRLGLLDDTLNAAIILVAIITCTAAPVLFNRWAPRAETTRERVLLVGAGEQGLLLAERLRQQDREVCILERDPAAARRARRLGVTVHEVDGATPAGLREAGADARTVLIAVTSDDAANLAVCRLARAEFGVTRLIGLAGAPEREAEFREAGAQPVTPALSAVAMLDALVTAPTALSLFTGVADDKQVQEVDLFNSALYDRRLREIELPGDVLVLSLRRGEEVLVPHGNTRLQPGDRLTLIGSHEAVRDAGEYLRR